ncbi:transcription initiation factor [Zalerion maritima]|uniref:Transcription initiation factor n=1 Tax=Zalerion maritima TaxID=339359 RepID=A0AAD5RN51_9PEZI|nr:transcription initiation factor [Zalerion maritima]
MNNSGQKPADSTPSALKGNPLRPIRRPRPTTSSNPLVQRRPKQNPALLPSNPGRPGHAPPLSPKRPSQPTPSIDELRRQYGGWSEPPPPGFIDYPLIVTKRDLKAARRFHVMRFSAVADKNEKTATDGTRSVDPSDSNQFTRPVTLHRRDARQPPLGRQVKEEAVATSTAPDKPPPTENEEEAARIAQAKADREAQRAFDLAQIAPVAKDPNAGTKKSKKNVKQEKVTAVFQRPDESFKKQSELHYEESLPWHLEDADGKNVWVGSYVGPLSETNAALVIEGSSFRMIPLEKFYKFKSKPPFVPYSIEQAENIMNKKAEVGRWAMLEEEKINQRKEMDESRRALYGPSKIKTESSSFKNSSRAEKMEHDELDMSETEFQDDDEQPTLERDDDEDLREAQQKIRRDQLGANLFGRANEEEVDRQVKEEEAEEEDRKVLGKAVRKMLLKREKEAVYATDSDDDPFKSSSEDEEEEEDGEAASGENTKGAAAKAGGPQGSTTPSGKTKHTDSLKKGKSLKRPGSPNLSDASSNESSRKKVKKSISSVKPSRATTPMASSSNLRSASSASDGEATTGDMSDSGPSRRKIAIVGNSNNTPSASRAGSPNPQEPKPLTPAELLAGIPPLPGALGILELIKKFPGRVGEGPGKVPKPIFIKMVREVAAIGPDKLLRRRS